MTPILSGYKQDIYSEVCVITLNKRVSLWKRSAHSFIPVKLAKKTTFMTQTFKNYKVEFFYVLTTSRYHYLLWESSYIDHTHWEVWIQKVHFLGVGSYSLFRPLGSIFWPYMILALIHIPTENKNNVNCKRHLVLKFSTFDLFKFRGWNFVRMIVPWVHHIVKISAP